jgi:hypothetical protein
MAIGIDPLSSETGRAPKIRTANQWGTDPNISTNTDSIDMAIRIYKFDIIQY